MIKERLNLILKELGLSGRALEKECGLANGSFSSIGDGVGADKLNRILVRFPQFSADWLLTGEGNMLKQEIINNLPVKNNNESNSLNLVHQEEMKSIVSQMADIISGQQQDISRLITELERFGERSDRMLNIIEHDRCGTTYKGDSLKKNMAG